MLYEVITRQVEGNVEKLGLTGFALGGLLGAEIVKVTARACGRRTKPAEQTRERDENAKFV